MPAGCTRPGDAERAAGLLPHHLPPAVGLDEELLRGQQQGGVLAVHAGVLHVLGDGAGDHLPVLPDCVELHLLAPRMYLVITTG